MILLSNEEIETMKHKIKKTKQRLRSVQRTRNHYRQYVPVAVTVQQTTVRPARKVLIYEGEYERLCRETLRMGSRGLETGGQFFGKATWNGVPVITYVLGPGPNAEQNPAFFRQDIPYLKREAERIFRLGDLTHLGEWHSHHHLGLSVPSGRDSKSMIDAIRMHSDMSQYLLSIAVCDNRIASATPFMYNQDGYETWEWDVIPGESPVRKILENA